ncbi:hypothetical protein E4U53_006051 [Claviceps sorghi]|nr:hypothetical protein E4U53_006051 [Claviceps sorghi]
MAGFELVHASLLLLNSMLTLTKFHVDPVQWIAASSIHAPDDAPGHPSVFAFAVALPHRNDCASALLLQAPLSNGLNPGHDISPPRCRKGPGHQTLQPVLHPPLTYIPHNAAGLPVKHGVVEPCQAIAGLEARVVIRATMEASTGVDAEVPYDP